MLRGVACLALLLAGCSSQAASGVASCSYPPLDATVQVGENITLPGPLPGQVCPRGQNNEYQMICTSDGSWSIEGSNACRPIDSGSTHDGGSRHSG